MIRLNRLPKPPILEQNEIGWRDDYLAKRREKPNLRPESRKYRHQEILDSLQAMSFNKCFYCEQLMDSITPEVDHYQEVTSHPELAFEWTNLYLACPECNLKIRTIPISDCIDPCQEDPSEYLTFRGEVIVSIDESEKGLKTIQKYKLTRQELTIARQRALQKFHEVLTQLQLDKQRRGGLMPAQQNLLRSFTSPTHPFSLMFKALLETNPTTLDILGSD